MREIHNTKHRMPVILEKADEDDWLNPDNADPDELMKKNPKDSIEQVKK